MHKAITAADLGEEGPCSTMTELLRAGCCPHKKVQPVPKAMESMSEAQELKSLTLVCCLITAIRLHQLSQPRHGSTQNRFQSLMKDYFSAPLLSLPKAAKQDLPLAFLLFNLSKLFWAWDPSLALPQDNLCRHLCTDLGTAAARSKVRALDLPAPFPVGFEKQVCQTSCSRQRHGTGLMLLERTR